MEPKGKEKFVSTHNDRNIAIYLLSDRLITIVFNGTQIREEMQKEREMSRFKAHPADVLIKQPFVPKKSTKALTGRYKLKASRIRSKMLTHYYC